MFICVNKRKKEVFEWLEKNFKVVKVYIKINLSLFVFMFIFSSIRFIVIDDDYFMIFFIEGFK